MSAPQLTDANTSSEWIRRVADPATGQARSPSQVGIQVTEPRKRFVRLVTYMMVGLVAFTLLGVASFAWRQRSMKAALEAPGPVAPAAAALVARPATPAAPLAPETNTEGVPTPPAPVGAAVPRPAAKKAVAAPAVAKSKPAIKSTLRTSPFLGAKKLAVKTR